MRPFWEVATAVSISFQGVPERFCGLRGPIRESVSRARAHASKGAGYRAELWGAVDVHLLHKPTGRTRREQAGRAVDSPERRLTFYRADFWEGAVKLPDRADFLHLLHKFYRPELFIRCFKGEDLLSPRHRGGTLWGAVNRADVLRLLHEFYRADSAGGLRR